MIVSIESILADLGKVLRFVGPHWPFIAYMFMFAFIGEVMKRQVLTPKNVGRLQREADKWWNRKGFGYVIAFVILAWIRVPLALQPLGAGFVLGLIPGVPVSAGVQYGAQSVIYCMTAGWMSTALYSFIKAVFVFWWKYVARKTEPVPTLHFPGDADDTVRPYEVP